MNAFPTKAGLTNLQKGRATVFTLWKLQEAKSWLIISLSKCYKLKTWSVIYRLENEYLWTIKRLLYGQSINKQIHYMTPNRDPCRYSTVFSSETAPTLLHLNDFYMEPSHFAKTSVNLCRNGKLTHVVSVSPFSAIVSFESEKVKAATWKCGSCVVYH